MAPHGHMYKKSQFGLQFDALFGSLECDCTLKGVDFKLVLSPWYMNKSNYAHNKDWNFLIVCNYWFFVCFNLSTLNVATPLWASVGVKPNTPKVRDLESSRTPECLEFNNKAQNTSHWGVLGVIEKVLKCRCPKWPRIGHLDICSPRYGQKKGRELNW
jgi:hypothetical protein